MVDNKLILSNLLGNHAIPTDNSIDMTMMTELCMPKSWISKATHVSSSCKYPQAGSFLSKQFESMTMMTELCLARA
jgi:hypothetical protein